MLNTKTPSIERPIKITHVVRQFYPAVGGLEEFVANLALQQIEQGFEVEVITLNRVFHDQNNRTLPENEVWKGINISRIPWAGSFRYPIAWQLLGKLKHTDIIHVHAVDFFVDFLSLTKFIHRKPIVLSTHGGFFHTPQQQGMKKIYFKWVTKQSLKNVSKVFTISQNDHDIFSEIRNHNLELILNGVDIDKFSSLVPQDFSRHLLYVGRFSGNKKIEHLIEMMRLLKSKHPDYHLTIMGKDWKGGLQELSNLVTKYQLEKVVTLYESPSNELISEQVQQHAFIISASEYEGFGLSIVEGMGAGLVPIVNDIPSFRSIVHQAQVGLVTNFSNPQEAAKVVDDYIKSIEPSYNRSSEQSRLDSTSYAWPKVAQEFTQAYQKVLGKQLTIQGVSVQEGGMEEVCEVLDNQVKILAPPLKVAIANAHTLNLVRKKPDYKKILEQFYVLNDGVGLDIAKKWKYGEPFVENLNGTDFIPYYLNHSRWSLRVFLLGAKPEVVQRCYEQCQQRFPQHQWVGYQDGYFDQAHSSNVALTIANLKVDLLLVAMGNPIQELWIHKFADQCKVRVAIGVGALFDFLAGKVNRAPLWVQQMRAEWVYRLLQEPGRMWQRYLIGNIKFLWYARKDARNGEL